MVTRLAASVTAYHTTLTRAELLRVLKQHGPEAVLPGFTGTLEEARAVIAKDPREVFVLDRNCDRQDTKGQCLGHRHVRCAGCGGWLAVLEVGDPVCLTCGGDL